MTDAMITIARADLQALFDTAVGSLDFGSDFLDTEEVDALRSIATALGVSVWEATPEGHLDHYCFDHVWTPWKNRGVGWSWADRSCERCGKRETGPKV